MHGPAAHPETTALSADQIAHVVALREQHLRDVRNAYYNAWKGVTYEDMRAAAISVLEWRQRYERASGRHVTTKITKNAIATLLRNTIRR